MTQPVCMGHGAKDTHAFTLNDGRDNPHPSAGHPYATIGPADIYQMVLNPPQVDKEAGPWIIPSSYHNHDARNHKAQHERGQYHWLAVDIDKGSPSKDKVVASLQAALGQANALVYSTRSATAETFKWRALIPLAQPLTGKQYTAYQQALFHGLQERCGLQVDWTLERVGQLVYLPNRGEYYDYAVLQGETFDALAHAGMSKVANDFLQAAERYQSDVSGKQEGARSPIAAFRRKHSVAELLEIYGYTNKAGTKDWTSPNSASGSASTRDYVDYWTSLGHGDRDAGIGRKANNSDMRTGDAFDLYVFYQCGGNREQALQYAEQCLKDEDKKRLGAATAEHGAFVWECMKKGFQERLQEEQLKKLEQLGPKQAHETPEANEGPYLDDEWGEVPSVAPMPAKPRPERPKEMTASAFYARFPKNQKPFPITNPTQLGGLAEYLANYLDEAAAVGSENGGTMMALSILGAIIGPRLATSGVQTRTNLNLVGLDDSGAGKSSLMNAAYSLLDPLSGQEGEPVDPYIDRLRGYEDFHSASAITKMFDKECYGDLRVKLCLMDEFGKILESARGGGAAHKREILNAFTRLFSKSNSIDLGTGAATEAAARTPIPYPHLNILGFSTPEVFWSAFSSGNLRDGSLARYLVFKLGDSWEQQENTSRVKEARTGVRCFSTWCAAAGGTPAEPWRVQWAAGVGAKRTDLRRSMAAAASYATKHGIPGAPAIIRRVAEMTAKLALILCASRCFFAGTPAQQAIISAEDFNTGAALALWCAGLSINSIPAYMAESEHDADAKEVLRYIAEGGQNGRTKKATDKRFAKRFGTSKLAAVYGSLIASESVLHLSEDTDRMRGAGGRPAERFIATE